MQRVDEYMTIANLIIKNIEERGMRRFDRMDFKWNPRVSLRTAKLYRLRKMILVLEEFFPIIMRRIWRIEKRVVPTTFTFIANAYYFAEKNAIEVKKIKMSLQIMEECMKEYLSIEAGTYWWNYEPELFSDAIIEKRKSIRPTMHLYGLTRCNMALIRIGVLYGKKDLLEIAYNSAIHVKNYHEVEDYGDEMAIGYFYNTHPQILNVNSEFAMWLAMLERYYKTDEDLSICLRKLVNLIISEQNEDGSWYYTLKRYRENYGVEIGRGQIDCHHTGTVLYNAISIVGYGILCEKQQKRLIEAVNKGMRFYLDAFFKNPARVRTFTDLSRPAGPSQYSEAVIAFCEFMKNSVFFENELVERVKKIIPLAMKKNLSFIQRDGSAKSEKIIRWVNIDSIRWGNGPVLESIFRYIDYLKWDEIDET